MRIVANFDPANPPAAQATSFNAQFSNGTGKIVVHNESNNNIQLSWGSFSTYCPAWMSMLYCVQSNTPNINWSVISTLVSTGSPISALIVEAYADNEMIVGTYPAALVRQTNIGNAVNTVGGGSSFIQNDANVAGTSIVEATPTGDSASAVQLSNTGNLTLGNATHPGKISSDNGKFTTDGSGTVTVGGTVTINGGPTGLTVANNELVSGTLAVTGITTLTGNLVANGGINLGTLRDNTTGVSQATLATAGITIQNLLTLLAGLTVTGNVNASGSYQIAGFSVMGAGANLHLTAPTGGQIIFDVTGGVGVNFIDGTGLTANNGVNFNIGRIKDINNGTVAANGTVNHGISGVPAAVLMTPAVSGSTWTVSAGSYTSTQFTATLNSALTTRWLAYR